MAGEFNKVRATGNYVVLEFVKVVKDLYEKRKGSSLLLPTGDLAGGEGPSASKESYKAVVYDIGPDVENPTYKTGDEVVFNQYDMKQVENDEGQLFGVIQGHSVMAVLE